MPNRCVQDSGQPVVVSVDEQGTTFYCTLPAGHEGRHKHGLPADDVFEYKGVARVDADDDNQLRIEIEPLTGMYRYLEEEVIENLKLQFNGQENNDKTRTYAIYNLEVIVKVSSAKIWGEPT